MDYVEIGCAIFLRAMWLLAAIMMLLGKWDYNGMLDRRWKQVGFGLVILTAFGGSIYHEVIEGKWNWVLEVVQ